MAIMTSTRRRVLDDRRAARLDGIQTAVSALRNFVEVEPNPAGREALLKAAKAIEQLYAG